MKVSSPVIITLLALNSIQVWGGQTEGYRCFNWPNCNDSNGCTKINGKRVLAELLDTCSNDEECVAVSCEGLSDGKCSRSMLSSYCDESTKDDENNWVIYPGMKLTVNRV